MISTLKTISYFLIFTFTFLSFRSYAQCDVGGKVVDSLKAPVPFITVALLNAKDSTINKGIITGEKGDYCFENLKKGEYLIKVAGVGYGDKYSEKFIYDSAKTVELPTLTLGKGAVNLNEVAITAIKDPIEFKGGNMTVNVEDSPLAVGNSAYDLLARLPGVMVEGDNISIQGKSGVKVYINDRPQQISGQQLINFLRGMNSSMIEKIEIIVNPPAKYDAAGSAGIINIKTKKIKITGASGGLNYTFSQGFYNNNFGGFSLNYKGRKVTVFSNVSGYEGCLRHESNSLNNVTYNGVTTTLDQRSYEIDVGKFLTVDLGADWYINRKNTIGVKAQIVPGYANRTYNGNTYISDNSLGYDRILYNRPIENYWYLANYNLNGEHLFDTSGTSKIKFSADYYGPYYDNYKAYYQNRFIGVNGVDTLPSKSFRTNNDVGLNIFAGRVDFEKQFKNELSLEAGLKHSDQKAYSNYTFENQNNLTGDFIVDSIYTNQFKYHEQISSGYISMDKHYKKFNLRAGLRGENTYIQTQSITANIGYTRQYFNLFPTLSIDHNPDKDNNLSFSYNRRINRPDYNSFNPFRQFNNILSSGEGNPYLMPVYDNNFNFTYVWKRKISNSMSYSNSEHPIQNYTTQNDSTKEIIAHLINMKSLNIIRDNLFVRQEIKKWWTLTFLLGAYYIDYNGIVNGQNYSVAGVPWYTRLTNIFIIKKNTKIEVSAFYWSPWYGNTTIFQHREGLSFAIKQSFLDNNLNVSIGLTDAFFTEQFRQKADFQNQHWTLYEAHDSRRLNLSVSYNFGKIKAQQRDTKENDEERRRSGK
jgi:iron complex outermembrane receptor protein